MNIDRLNGFMICPFCLEWYELSHEPGKPEPLQYRGAIQPMWLYADDLNPKRNRLFCPHCDFEIEISDVDYGINE